MYYVPHSATWQDDLFLCLYQNSYWFFSDLVFKMPIVHIVLFKFKEGTKPAVVKDVREASLVYKRPVAKH
jgi:hypothetical protein